MATGTDCCSPCPEVQTVNIPGAVGADGAAGADGADGVNAYTVTTGTVTLPAAAGAVVLATTVVVSSWASIGQIIFISDGTNWGHFRVLTKPSTTSLTLEWLDYYEDAAGTTVIASGAAVSPSGTQPGLSAALPTDITDNSTGTASNVIAAGTGIFTLAFPITLASMTAAAADLLTNYTLGYAFKILSISFSTTTISAGAGASMVLNAEINATNVTGGVLTVTLASTDTLGELTAATAITAANTGLSTDTLSIEVAAGGTIFTAGEGVILVRVQNTDSVNAVASLAKHVDDLIVALTP